ncbi:MAG: hypothetical protein ACAI44_15760, partial [Candidatus Sericytochromatia bacterium]
MLARFGRFGLSGGHDRQELKWWDLEQRALLKTIPNSGCIPWMGLPRSFNPEDLPPDVGPPAVALHTVQQGHLLYSWCAGDKALRVWELSQGKLVQVVNLQDYPVEPPDQRAHLNSGLTNWASDARLAVVRAKRHLLVYQLETGRLVTRLPITNSGPDWFTISNDRLMTYTNRQRSGLSSSQTGFRLYHLPDLAPLASLPDDGRQIWESLSSPPFLLTADTQGLRLWNLERLEVLKALNG